MAQIAFLGTGLLGSAFAEAATRRGDTVTAWNRSVDKVRALAEFGVKAAANPAEAVRGAERVHIVLKEDAVVDEVIDAARPGLAAATVLIDHSTTLPKLTAARFARLQAQDIRYLHCPVFMGPPAARNAQGLMLATGPKALFESVQADLARMTGRLEYLGEHSNLAAVNKLLGNAMIIGTWAVLADVLTLAKACGVEGADAVRLLGFIDMNAMMSRRAPSMASGDFTPNFELAMARKDLRLMLEAIGTLPLAALPGIATRMDRLIAEGHGGKDAGVLSIDAVRRA